MYQALDVPKPELVKTLLRARDHRARAAATRVLSHWQERLPDALALLAGLPLYCAAPRTTIASTGRRWSCWLTTRTMTRAAV
jgi:hypothetical protein